MRLTYLKALTALVASFLQRSERSQALRALGVSTVCSFGACTLEICVLHLGSSRELPLDNMVAKCHFSSIIPILLAWVGVRGIGRTACGRVVGAAPMCGWGQGPELKWGGARCS